MTSAADILRSAGITTKSTAPGRYYAICPKCSANRKPAHQKLECLGITIDEKGVTWGCNHCNWKGGGSYEPYPAKKNGGGLPFVAQYIYRQADSAPYLKVCRTAEKQFPQFHWDGSGWKKGKPNGPKIPYRLPELLAASVGTTIYFCEGEKDADAVHALGLLGTTCSEGAPNGWREELAPWFKDRHVVVLPDNDLAGRKLARKVAKSLFGIAASVKIVELLDLKEGQDVSDFLTRDRAGVKFIQLCKAAPLWEPSTDRDGGKDDTSDDELIAQLAALPRIEYAKRRKDAAKGLGITLAELDKIVAEARGETSAATPERWSVTPWDTVINTAELLAALRDTFMRYIIMPLHAAIAMALWTLHAWALDAAYVSPFLMFSSPEMRCGKSTALALLYRVGPRTALASNISPAAIFRYVEASHPTLLIDEAETFVTGNEEVRGILNSGHTRDTAIIIRLVGDNHEPKEFSTWSAKAIASIGKLSGTLRDRSIILPMKRKKPNERVAKLRGRDTDEFLELRRKARRWADDNVAALKEACPSIPEVLNDRAADNWEPLLAIADLAGNEWPRLARTAAVKLSADSEVGAESDKVRLLADIRAIFEELALDRLPSASLVAELVKDADGRWAAYGRNSKPITQRQVATLLSEFTTPSGAKIKPRNVRTDGKVPKGYAREDFADAFERYLSPSPLFQSATPLQTNDISDLKEKSSATPDFFVANENEPNALKSNACSGVADRDPPVGEEKDRTCAQCQGPVDGKERQVATGRKTVWLHPECERFHLKAEVLPW
jgi:5S rRNA maturation endonuclease (ribonuclease M5)